MIRNSPSCCGPAAVHAASREGMGLVAKVAVKTWATHGKKKQILENNQISFV